MNANLSVPSPLFDTLEYLNKSNVNFPELTEGHAKLDHQHATNFLYHYRGSLATFNAYRREIERFLQWCWFVQKKSLNKIDRMDIVSNNLFVGWIRCVLCTVIHRYIANEGGLRRKKRV